MIRSLLLVTAFLSGHVAVSFFADLPNAEPSILEEPDLIVAFAGDLDGYLEECG